MGDSRQQRRKPKGPSLEEVALGIFGSTDSPGYQRWIEYWRQSRSRNRELLERFRRLVLMDFRGKRVLDVGSGTGGLGETVSEQGGSYIGIDLHWHVLQFSFPSLKRSFVQSSGLALPFPSRTFDMVFAFDVIEHLEGGRPWQLEFLKELKRVLLPTGMIFLTTPNFWYPYDAHSELWFPHYLPEFLQDHYISWRNPEFLREHTSFRSVRLMTPFAVESAIREEGLLPLHHLPCCLDRDEYVRLHPIRGLLAYLGLGWYFHAEFWFILVHASRRSVLRRKLRKTWFYERDQPLTGPPTDFGPSIDFDEGLYNHQLGPGWHRYERDRRGFRWTDGTAVCFLQSRERVSYLHLKGYSPIAHQLLVRVDGCLVGQQPLLAESCFELKYLLPFPETDHRIFEIIIESIPTQKPQAQGDERELGIMIFSVAVS